MKLELLLNSLENAKVIKKGIYRYFIHPLTDSIPPIQPELMKEVCMAVIDYADLDVDYIVTMEAMGIHFSSVIGQMKNIPVNIIRKREYGLNGEIKIAQTTGYSKNTMYLNSVKKGDIVTIFDSVISTGGTLIGVINALNEAGALVKDVVCVIERGDGVKRVYEETGYTVKTLAKIDVCEKVKIVKTAD